MNPSTSSNADAAREGAFKVGLRQLSPDLKAAGEEHQARELGLLSGSQLVELLQKLVQIPPDQLIDAEPHLVVGARRGRFIIRPSRGKLRLFDANDLARAYLELTPGEVPLYLDGTEPGSAPAAAEFPPEALDAPNPRLGLVAGLFVLSATLLGGSAYFTFRENNWDTDSDYSAASTAEIAGLRQLLPGVFATGKGNGTRAMTIRAEGTVTLVESGPGNTVADQREDRYQLALHHGKTPVARAKRLGPIEIRDAKTLFYAGETYTRQP